MLIHPNFDPVAIAVGPIAIHWYGLMYLLGFAGVYFLGSHRARNNQHLRQSWTTEDISDLVFYGALGAVLGGRLGYVLFYKPIYYLANPLEIFMINQGGMSFHGGLLGVIVALVFFARQRKWPLLDIADFVAPLAPIGLFFGRVGNFINQELWGKPTDLPWAMVFQTADNWPRHPSMLYEALLEGLVLFFVLLWFTARPYRRGSAAGLFLAGYAIARFLVEFVRIPDAHLNYLAFGWLTMGQLLTIPMLIGGLYLVFKK